MSALETPLTRDAKIEVPLICGAMYPCSNPELVAAVSEAGAIGIVQPMSMVYVHGLPLVEGLKRIRSMTAKPVGFNAILERASKTYDDRMRRWIDEALEAGVRFFVTALGNPASVVARVHAAGGVVYHDVTERKWAEKALEGGVDGLICVNRLAGGHAGQRAPEALYEELAPLGVPLVAAGGVGDEAGFARMLRIGYAGVQLGTRFIATSECTAHSDYKQAIVAARAEDIVLTERLSGVPCAIINTPFVAKTGTKAGPIARWMLRGRRTKKWMRTIYALRSLRELKQASMKGQAYRDYWQAGRSVEGIRAIEPADAIVRRFAAALRN
ncbi:MAG TPA: nitronate monooxygenase [Candidatus Polarisedimenticolaceae bacterium]